MSARRTFGPAVLLGLAGALLTAIGGTKHWVSTHPPLAGSAESATGTAPALDAPAVTALGLVALAAWGVALVARGLVRRLVLGLAAVAALGSLAVWRSSAHAAEKAATTAAHLGTGSVTTSLTAWPWLAGVGALVAAATAIAGIVLAPGWPEMGRKYDAPAGAAPARVPLEEQSSLDVWKTLDEGRDPTTDES